MTKHIAPKSVLKNMGLSTQHQFRMLKREKLTAVLNAMDDFSSGCAYAPDFTEIVNALSILRRARKNMSVKQWGK